MSVRRESPEKNRVRVASKEELESIVKRLYSTHTKSSSGSTSCKTYNPLPSPGYGQKMYPIIPGLESRFSGRAKTANPEATKRLYETKTRATTARLKSPQILLWPERTLLMNDVNKIRDYYQSGTLAKQSALPRREKWYI
ncbi:hypothetical protein LSH36_7g16103 [Paralvinella palmiformis]|uniref:Uncharacterized protein n=1 Tax=Paralvinella palmiformis TaxID=53620 RepID=A0AAD9KEN1_9ANNE|nr:hypothetical protein LSH36_7g16103 [Paralvinella palmiformis]